MKQSALLTCVSRPSLLCVCSITMQPPDEKEGDQPAALCLRVGQAFNAFCGVSSTSIRWGLAVSAFGNVIVSTPRL